MMKFSEMFAILSVLFASFGVAVFIGVWIMIPEYLLTSPMVFIVECIIGLACVIFGTWSISEKIKESKENEEA